jgi:hypothetical protein
MILHVQFMNSIFVNPGDLMAYVDALLLAKTQNSQSFQELNEIGI